MTKRTVVRVAARGYVDGRYIGEEKEVIEAIDPSGRGKRRSGKGRGKAGPGQGQGQGQGRVRGKGKGAGGAGGRGNVAGSVVSKRGAKRGKAGGGIAAGGVRADDIGNRVDAPRPPREGGRNKKRGKAPSGVPPMFGDAVGGAGGDTRRNRRGRGRKVGVQGGPGLPGAMRPDDSLGNTLLGGNTFGAAPSSARAKRNRGGKRTPFRSPSAPAALAGGGRTALISEVAETRRWGDEAKSGQFAEALAKEANIKRERLHKVLAQSGHGSRRDMEIMISSGRVMVNGIVATTGTSVSPQDAVMIDHRPVKLKFGEELPRVLLYHKPDGEIVTTNDPGNRITVFDNLPRVENGKWMAIGRLDINTSGLLIFTTSGELANRLMHPRYEVEREYAVRTLGELTAEQQQRLLDGVSIAGERDEDEDEEDDVVVDERPAKFDSIEERGGEGVNRWYHVVIREGRNREVRKMFEAVGLTVSRLIRVRFGKIGLPPRLSRGRMMELAPEQVRAVLKWVGMEVEGRIGALPTNVEPKRNAPRGQPRDAPHDGQRKLPPEGQRDVARAARSANEVGDDWQDDDFEPVDGRVVDALLQEQGTAEGTAVPPGGELGRDRKRGNRRGRRGRRDDRNDKFSKPGKLMIAADAESFEGAVGSADAIPFVDDMAQGSEGAQLRQPRAPQTTQSGVQDDRRGRRNRRGRVGQRRGEGEARGNANIVPDADASVAATEPGNRVSRATSAYDDDVDDNIGNRISAPASSNANTLLGGEGAARAPRGQRGLRTPNNLTRRAGGKAAVGTSGRNRRPRGGGRGGSGGGGESSGNI